MTSHVSLLFKKSLIVTAIGAALIGCGGGNGLSNGGGGGGPDDCETLGTCPPPDCETLGNCPPPDCEALGNCPPPPTADIEVRDFGGLNGKIVLDANHDSFAVGTNGTLYVYNAAAGAPNPDSDLIPANRLARVKNLSVTNDDAILYGDDQIGSIAADQTTEGQQFYVLAYGAGTEQGYIDIDYNKHYGGYALDDKTDARIKQLRAVAVQNSFQGLLGNVLWQATDGDLVTGTNIESLPAVEAAVNFEFTPATTENYHFVLREFDSPNTDLDIRLIDTLTGRILASSYSSLDGELISFPLTADKTYGVNVSRSKGSDDVSFLLSVKASPDTDSTDSLQLPDLAAASSYTLRGTIHPITRFEFLSRFPAYGDATGDASSDSLFRALLDASSDASSDSSDDASSDDATSDPAVANQADVDKFWFGSKNTSFLTDYTFKTISEGGDYVTNAILTYLSDGKPHKTTLFGFDGDQRVYKRVLNKGSLTYDLQLSERANSFKPYQEQTIEYEMVIERE